MDPVRRLCVDNELRRRAVARDRRVPPAVWCCGTPTRQPESCWGHRMRRGRFRLSASALEAWCLTRAVRFRPQAWRAWQRQNRTAAEQGWLFACSRRSKHRVSRTGPTCCRPRASVRHL